MTFAGQLTLAALFGGGVLLIGLLKVIIGSGVGASPFLSCGLAVLSAGVPLRLWMRRAWLSSEAQVSSDQAGSAKRLLAGPFRGFWLWWLWLTPEGRARD